MSHTEQLINLASKLYKCRSNLKALFKEEFFEKIKVWQELIKKMMEKKNISELEAMIDILHEFNDKPVVQTWIMAAAIELIEPSLNEAA